MFDFDNIGDEEEAVLQFLEAHEEVLGALATLTIRKSAMQDLHDASVIVIANNGEEMKEIVIAQNWNPIDSMLAAVLTATLAQAAMMDEEHEGCEEPDCVKCRMLRLIRKQHDEWDMSGDLINADKSKLEDADNDDEEDEDPDLNKYDEEMISFLEGLNLDGI